MTASGTRGLAGPITALVLLLGAGAAAAGGQAGSPSAGQTGAGEGKPALQTITIEAQRRLNRQVSHYVSTVVVHYMHDSLMRWNAPLCPLVAGLRREGAEFMLARISQVAASARVPLAGEHCRANLYVVVTPDPDLLLKQWWRRDRTMYNTANGMGPIDSFLHSRYPIRAWYNASFVSTDGAPMSADTLAAGLSGSGLEMILAPVNRVRLGTRLLNSAVQSLSSVIVIVDMNRTQELSMGQLADYVAMIGLAQIRVDADLGEAPSILKLFAGSADPPQGLSPWDEAFLYSLYNSPQASAVESGAIKTSMLKRLAPY